MSGDGPTTTAVHDPRRTVGVEEELLLVDAQTGEPRSLAASALAAAESDPAVARASEDHGGELEGELQQQQLETGTRPCRDVSELITELRRWRSLADRSAQQVGARAVALATSPIAVPPSVTPNPRYRRMVAEFGLTAAEQLACGCHVHVAVESEAEGVAVLDRIRVWLPVLLACSANSPFWQGEETGYASFRSQAWGRWPVAGPTDAFGSAEAYHSLVQRLLDSRTVLDHGMLYFDARLSAQYPTVEVRVADVCLEVADAALIACLTRALVETAARSWRAGEPAPAMPTSVLRMAMWRAGRSGLRAELLDPLTGRPEPAGDVVGRLVGHVRAVLAPDELIMVERRVEALLRDGSGADRQLARWRSDHDLAGVVADAAEITHR